MPILLPPGLPAASLLRAEGIAVEETTAPQPGALRIGLVNLMPDRPTTETQFARLLGASPETVSMSLFTAGGCSAGRTPREHLARFYADLYAAHDVALDGIIITGAPVETLPFSEVRYWPALAALFDTAAARGCPTLSVCWAAMAALHHGQGVEKQLLPRKLFGLYAQTVHDPAATLMQGLPSRLLVPVSRHASVPVRSLAGTGARMIAGSTATGVSIAIDEARAQSMVLDHLEYDGDTLIKEFVRDRAAALPAEPPIGLSRDARAESPWRATAHLLMRNWLGAVARAKARRRPADLLDWLLDPSHDRQARVELVVRNDPGADILPALVAICAAAAIRLDGTSRHVSGAAMVATLARGTDAASAEYLARRVLALDGVREVVLRGPGAAGLALRAAA